MNNEKDIINTSESGAPASEKKKKRSFGILKVFIALVVIAVLGFFGFTCEVREGSCALILRFGAPREEITEAGLYFRLPWPFETVVTYENRLQCLESNDLETITKDNRTVILQSYVLWKVSNPLTFHNRVGAEGNVDAFIGDQVWGATNSVMGAYKLSELVSLDYDNLKTKEIQAKIFEAVKETCEKSYGIEVSEVSILRISLPDANLSSVFEQMRADRQKDIDTIIANAARDANKITSEADAEASRIMAEGEILAAEIRAQTETEVARIYAEAQAANLELFTFLKELDTLVASVGTNTVLVVTADTYPFNVLLEYSDTLTDESEDTVIADLGYILTQLPEDDRQALVDAIYELIEAAGGTQQ